VRHWREYALAHCQHRSGKMQKKMGAKGTHSLECAEFGAVQDVENGKPGRVRPSGEQWIGQDTKRKRASSRHSHTGERMRMGLTERARTKKRWLSRLSGPKLVVSRPSRP